MEEENEEINEKGRFDVVVQSYDHFVEAEELLTFTRLCETSVEARRDCTTISRIAAVLNKYQEQPQLIDRHLDECLAPLMRALVREMIELSELATERVVMAPAVDDSTVPSAARADPLALHDWQAVVASDTTGRQGIFRLVYLTCKVRGYKAVVRLLPHEPAQLVPVLAYAERYPADGSWEGRYVLLLWLSMLSRVPFNMEVVGSDAPQRIVALASYWLGSADTARDASAVLLARFLTREDMAKTALPAWIDSACAWLVQAGSVACPSVPVAFRLMGTLLAITTIFKHGRRDMLQPLCTQILDAVGVCVVLESSQYTVLRKLKVKLLQRVALTFLPPRVAKWRYRRGNRSLSDNLRRSLVAHQQGEENQQEQQQQQQQQQHQQWQQQQDDGEEEEDDVPVEVESIVGELLEGLADVDTVVRWSAAKGIGRVTGRLSLEQADDVVQYVIELLSDSELAGAWHGACLCLGELARRGLLLPTRLQTTVMRVQRALHYDRRVGSHSIGSHVRDAACYVCWAFARAYAAETMSPYVSPLACALLQAATTDREVNCRRAAAAAFQECVGRQGNFPHGIDIVQGCDFHAVGARAHAFVDVALLVASFDEYTLAIVDHIVDTKTVHWDVAVRSLAARSLARLFALAPDHFLDEVIPLLTRQCHDAQLFARHGALLTLSACLIELVRADALECALVSELLGIVQAMASKRFRGAGGEVTRTATMGLVECLCEAIMSDTATGGALARVVCAPEGFTQVFAVVDSCVRFSEHTVQDAAADALRALVLVARDTDTLATVVLHPLIHALHASLVSGTPDMRRGLVLALGRLPGTVASTVHIPLLDALLAASVCATNRDPESRAVAAHALGALVSTVQEETKINLAGDTDLINRICNALLECTQDYATDRRGDIGSLVREAALDALVGIVRLRATAAPDALSASTVTEVVSAIVQQALERIDRTRMCAGRALCALLDSCDPVIPHFPCRSTFEALFQEYGLSAETNWSVASTTFPALARVIAVEERAVGDGAMRGLVASVGGLTESLVRSAGTACVAFFRDSPTICPLLVDSLLGVLAIREHEGRFIVPALKTLDRLLAEGALEAMHERDDVAERVLVGTRASVAQSGDVHRLSAAVNVYCGLLAFDSVRVRAFSSLMVLLCHRFPRVRKLTGEQLYVGLLTYSEAVDDEGTLDEAMALLSDVEWDSDLAHVRSQRNALCALLSVPVPQAKSKT